jgi:hypothetical protein
MSDRAPNREPGWYLGRPYAVWREALDLDASRATSIATHADGATTWSIQRDGEEAS